MPPGRSPEHGIIDPYYHPLTWGTVRASHAWLVIHASCEDDGVASYESDEEFVVDGECCACPCLWHPAQVEEKEYHRAVCALWPGPVCGACWAASCECGYVFADVSEAAARWPSGRLQCAACRPARVD